MAMLSVVIKCLNGADTIAEALDSLVRQRDAPPWEIVLADNGSTDATRAIFASYAERHPEIPMRLVDASDAPGRSHALNVGIRAARGDRLAFLDADDTVEPTWLAAMAAALDRHPFVAARFDMRRLNEPWVASLRPAEQNEGLARLRYGPRCPHAGGATLGFHRRVFDAVGGFDPACESLEDTDFCIRAHLAGFELTFAPEAVYNYRFRSEPAAIRRQARDYARASARLRRRYGDEPFFAPAAWIGLGARLARLWLAQAKPLVTRKPRTVQEEARLQRVLGRALGEAEGGILHRVAPPKAGRSLARTARGVAGEAAQRALAPFYGALVSVRTREKFAALTFDDGPDPESTPRLLDLLARLGVRATFFVVGARAERHPDLVARILAEGHEIGNHTWDHPSLPTVAPAEAEAQLRRTADALARCGSRSNGPWLMRPPYGDHDLRTTRMARRLGYLVVLWSLSGGDWRGESAGVLAGRISGKLAPGSIVLLHDSLYSYEDPGFRDRAPTIEAVRLVVEGRPDYRFVTVSDLLARGAPVERVRVKATARAELAALGFADGPRGGRAA